MMDPTARSTPVLAEDLDSVGQLLDSLGADSAAATVFEAVRRLDPDREDEMPVESVSGLSRDDLVDRFTAAVDNACDVAAIEVEVHELDLGPRDWQRNGQTSPLRRLVRAMEGAGLLDYSAIEEAT